ncbi:hypothetical protein DJ031_01755 [bacterium endosymbiont of Escarpia laminata]|nr:MAG: hypothetical protein DJ031_01755 [bacterium endosymbiont of Escarpia laminata]
MTVEIVEVLRRSEQGATRPFICRGDDGEIYFVKGLDAGRRSQICEWIAGRLAVLMGLPVAPFAFVEVPGELLELEGTLDLTGLGAGLAFGSMERRVNELTISVIDQIPDALQQDVLIFDWWVRNADRCLSEHGGNPNLFWDPGRAELVVIDHNQAFDLNEKRQTFSDYHVFRDQIWQLSEDFFRRDEYNERLVAALQHWPEILAEIPETWWFADTEMTVPVDFDADLAYSLLKGFERDDFWIWT